MSFFTPSLSGVFYGPYQICSIIFFCLWVCLLLPSWNWQRLDVNKYPSSSMNCAANGAWTWESSAEELTQLFGVSQVPFYLTCFWEWSLESAMSLLLIKYCFEGSWMEEPWAQPACEPVVTQHRQSHRRHPDSLLALLYLAGRHSLWLIFCWCPRAYVVCVWSSDT